MLRKSLLALGLLFLLIGAAPARADYIDGKCIAGGSRGEPCSTGTGTDIDTGPVCGPDCQAARTERARQRADTLRRLKPLSVEKSGWRPDAGSDERDIYRQVAASDRKDAETLYASAAHVLRRGNIAFPMPGLIHRPGPPPAKIKRKKRKQTGAITKTGDCTKSRYKKLKRKVQNWCKRPGEKRACRAHQDCPTLLDNLRKNKNCLKARRKVMNLCFRGGDKGHKKKAHEELLGVINCLAIIARKCRLDGR